MSMIDELMPYGVDMVDAMERFADSVPLYEKLLKKIPDMVKSCEVMEYCKSGDYVTALANAHTLKGTWGNLSIISLFQAYEQAVILFRANKPAEATAEIERILPIQTEVVEIIEKYL